MSLSLKWYFDFIALTEQEINKFKSLLLLLSLFWCTYQHGQSLAGSVFWDQG